MSVWSLAAVGVCLVLLFMMMTRRKGGATWLLVALLVAPYLEVRGVRFRIELILMPLMLGVQLLRWRGSLLIPRVVWLTLLPWLWVFSVTAIDLLLGRGNSVLWPTVYGAIRPVLIVAAFYNARYSHDDAMGLLQWFTCLAVPLGLFALAQSVGSGLASTITVAGYTSSSRTVVASLLGATGKIVRATSVFESPVYAATFFLLTLGTGIVLLTRWPGLSSAARVWVWVSVSLSTLAGITTFSSTFLLGIGVLAIWLVVRSRLRDVMRLTAVAAGLACVLLLMFGVSPPDEDRHRSVLLGYQMQRIRSLSVFETRYGDYGILSTTLRAVEERPVQGWGWLEHPGVFVGDSYYVSTLFTGGWIGLLLSLLASSYVLHLRHGTKLPGEVLLLWLIILLAAGVGSPSFTIPRVQDWFWALTGVVAWGHRREWLIAGKINTGSARTA